MAKNAAKYSPAQHLMISLAYFTSLMVWNALGIDRYNVYDLLMTGCASLCVTNCYLIKVESGMFSLFFIYQSLTDYNVVHLEDKSTTRARCARMLGVRLGHRGTEYHSMLLSAKIIFLTIVRIASCWSNVPFDVNIRCRSFIVVALVF